MNTVQFLRTAQKQLENSGATVLRDVELATWHSSHSKATIVLKSGAQFTASVIVLSLGYGFREFEALKQLNLHAVKGQIVRVVRLHGLKLELPICGEGYVAPGKDALILGTTYERDFVDVAPTSRSQRAIVRLTSRMVPALARAHVLGTAAGVRVGVPGTRLPMVGPIGHRVWIFTGLGSKGLLFAPHIARQLPSWLENAESVPPEIRVRLRNSNR